MSEQTSRVGNRLRVAFCPFAGSKGERFEGDHYPYKVPSSVFYRGRLGRYSEDLVSTNDS
jgi:hypothetical protein